MREGLMDTLPTLLLTLSAMLCWQSVWQSSLTATEQPTQDSEYNYVLVNGGGILIGIRWTILTTE